MRVFAIDPGPERSGWVLYDGRTVVQHGLEHNPMLLAQLAILPFSSDLTVVVEQMANFGHAVGRTIFDTVFWAGRFVQQVESHGGRWDQMTRPRVKLSICRSVKATDADVRRALLLRFGEGPLEGIATHQWAALALAVAWFDWQRLGVIVLKEGRRLPLYEKTS